MQYTLTPPRRNPPLALSQPQYGNIVSASLYHESTHMAGIHLADVDLDDGSPAYGWSRIMQLDTTVERLMNADSYTFLGLLARYETLGWYLDPCRGRGSGGFVTRRW